MKKKKRRLSVSDIIGNILCVILIPIVVINLILIAGSYIHPEAMPGIFGTKPAIVLSGSMEPAIETGDLIFIHKADVSGIKEGDVICYLSSGKAVTHRVMALTAGEDGKPRYVTKGDANNAEDQLAVSADQIEGIWRGGRIRGLGDGILFMQTTTGMILFIICPLLLFVLWDLLRLRRMDQKETARTAELEAELEALKQEKEAQKLS